MLPEGIRETNNFSKREFLLKTFSMISTIFRIKKLIWMQIQIQLRLID